MAEVENLQLLVSRHLLCIILLALLWVSDLSSLSSQQPFAANVQSAMAAVTSQAAYRYNKITPLGPASYRTRAPLGLNLRPSIKLMQSRMCGGQTIHSLLCLKKFRNSGPHIFILIHYRLERGKIPWTPLSHKARCVIIPPRSHYCVNFFTATSIHVDNLLFL